MILETQRLYLRELCEDDWDALCLILQDEITMKAYEHAFSKEEVRAWLDQQYQRYREDGFGLWAVVRKSDHKMIGQCGLTRQQIRENTVLEIGYLFQRAEWHQGYASEAAIACKAYAFHTLHAKKVYSIIRDTNSASKKVAIRNGMVLCDRFTKHYYHVDMPHEVYCIENKESI